jgi:hypothetical protein
VRHVDAEADHHGERAARPEAVASRSRPTPWRRRAAGRSATSARGGAGERPVARAAASCSATPAGSRAGARPPARRGRSGGGWRGGCRAARPRRGPGAPSPSAGGRPRTNAGPDRRRAPRRPRRRWLSPFRARGSAGSCRLSSRATGPRDQNRERAAAPAPSTRGRGTIQNSSTRRSPRRARRGCRGPSARTIQLARRST